MTSVYSIYTGNDELIGMDHPLFAARSQTSIWASWDARAGVPLAQAMQILPPQIRALFGDVPGALISATILTTYAAIAAEQEAQP